jgi:hypothetical protein
MLSSLKPVDPLAVAAMVAAPALAIALFRKEVQGYLVAARPPTKQLEEEGFDDRCVLEGVAVQTMYDGRIAWGGSFIVNLPPAGSL